MAAFRAPGAWCPSVSVSRAHRSQRVRHNGTARCIALSQSSITSEDAAALYESAIPFIRNISSSSSSLDLWMPAALLWFTFATPSSLLGVLDFAAGPLHALSHKQFAPGDVEVGKKIGEGSFGMVFEGFVWDGSERRHVILKKAKARVSGASEMHSSEVHMNHYLQRNASAAVATFLGTVQVTSSQAKGKLSEGIWLVWKFQGYHSLDYFMKQKSFPANVADEVLRNNPSEYDDDGAIIRAIMEQILSNLQQIHRVGVVHRDVKPLNVILAKDSSQFKLVDFGACVNLRSGYNYSPKETVMDPIYAAPEQYVMPTSTPRLPPEPFCSVIAPFVWLLNTPDRFDIFSAGLVMMQLAVKPLRSDIAMKRFTEDLKRVRYDLNKWRQQCQIAEKEFWLLDADDRSGWELVTALLQPRHDQDFMIWPGILRSRPSAAGALRHRFFRKQYSRQLQEFPDVLDAITELLKTRPLAEVNSTALASNIEAAWTKLGPEMYKLLEKLKSVDLISATVVTIAISTTWTVLNGLQSSVQVSYEAGRKGMEYIALFGALVTVAASVKPLLRKLQQAAASSGSSSSENLLARHPKYGEVVSLNEALTALELRLSSLEASVLQDQELFDSRFQKVTSLVSSK